MNKNDVGMVLVEVAKQKTGAASIAGGAAAATTSLVDGITPYIPVVSFLVMVLFGLANLWINWKKFKMERDSL